MKKLLFLILIMLFIIFYFVSGSYSKTLNKTFKIDPSKKITLKNINGNIKITTQSGQNVIIEAVKSSDRQGEIEKIKINFEYDSEGIKVYPSGYRNRTSVTIRYNLKIPKKLNELYIKNVNGYIKGSGNFSNVEARTVNGEIKFSAVMNDCNLATVNGSISLFQEDIFTGDISLKSVNGSITIELDPGSSLSLKGGALNGRIKSDFPLNIKKDFIGSSFSGKLGTGEKRLRIKTVNGSISIYKK